MLMPVASMSMNYLKRLKKARMRTSTQPATILGQKDQQTNQTRYRLNSGKSALSIGLKLMQVEEMILMFLGFK